MTNRLKQTFREVDNSPAVSAYIRTLFQKLEKFNHRIIHCHVIVERAQKRQQNVMLYSVKIHLAIPMREINSDHNQDENLYKAIHKGFNRIQRQLRDTTHIIEGMTKHHQDIIQGKITKIFAKRGYGFIESQFGEVYYFSTNNLSGKSSLTNLRIGSHVEFTEHLGNEGLQANRVKVRR